MLVAALLLATTVAFWMADRDLRSAVAEDRDERTAFTANLAHRATSLIARRDDLRLSVLIASAADISHARIMVLDETGTVRLDTAVREGGTERALVTADADPIPVPGPEHVVVQSKADGESSYFVPVFEGADLVGELRLDAKAPTLLGAFDWQAFGVVFFSALALIALAGLMVQRWSSSVMRATHAVNSLTAASARSTNDLDANGAGEVFALHEALRELDQVTNRGLDQVATSVLAMARHMVDSLEHRGFSPQGHGRRTWQYASLLVDRVELIDADREDLERAALLHDLGKMWVRPSVLAKEEPLTATERASLRHHPGRAAEVLGVVQGLQKVALLVRHHHEKFDGSGYPDGLHGERIPLGARVLAIAAAYDLLTSCTVQGDTLQWDEALDALREDRGVHFDPWLLDLFEEEIARAPIPEPGVDRDVLISSEGVLSYKAGDADPDELDEETLNADVAANTADEWLSEAFEMEFVDQDGVPEEKS